MKMWRCSYDPDRGWDALPPPEADGGRTLVLAFAAPDLSVGPAVAALRERLPVAVLMGCSTAGEIHQARVLDDTISAAVIQFAETDVRLAVAPVSGAGGSRGAGVDVARQLAAPDLRCVIVLTAGLRVNGSELIGGINEVLGPRVTVSGGLAGDGAKFGETWVFDGDRRAVETVSAVGLYGSSIRVACGSGGGWSIFGPERLVTRSEGNVLFELDGKPALDLYKNYLGDRALGLPTTALLFPLAILRDNGERLVRTVLSVDEQHRSMTFAGDVPLGVRTQLMRANYDRLVMGASAAATATHPRPGVPELALAISCVGRRLVLKGRVEEELEATLEALPEGSLQVGFYSYGELSPSGCGSCELHNQTMTLTTLHEEPS